MFIMQQQLLKLFAIFALATTGGAFVEGQECADFEGCGRCLKKSSDASPCAWAAGETDARCVSQSDCDADTGTTTEGGDKCYYPGGGDGETTTTGTKKAHKTVCRQTCESQSSCGSCLGYEVAGPNQTGGRGRSDCAWFVRGTEARCVSRSSCRRDKGFEGGRCLRGRKKQDGNEARCNKAADKERGCGRKKKCARCLGFAKNGATCSWRAGEDDCVEASSCTDEDYETGTCTGSAGSPAENKSTCGALKNDSDKLTPVEEDEEDKEGEDDFPPVPKIGHVFEDLLDTDRKVAQKILEDTYGRDNLLIIWLPTGSPVTEDVVDNRVRLFVDTETERIVVEIPKIG